eukprot:TRINITY_DN12302_c0_g1_i1.p1 TRINITY_DN12302_c0_g1~~TRINITY_DN12302_c0_g1_i1.p1  ORF type:complete len:357 (+),score=44.05 TRINITY_DN12302_c0_g1_i1:14-1084(+)
MIKLHYFFLVLLICWFATIVNSQTCDAPEDECKFEEESCSETGDCAKGLYCISGTCKFSTQGDDCDIDSDCYGNALQQCVDGVCERKWSPNDRCFKDDDCYKDLECVSHKCASKSTGDECDEDIECGYDHYCLGGTLIGVCAERVNDGAVCLTSQQCQYHSSCDLGICKPITYVDEGESCNNFDRCRKNLACNQDHVCVSADPYTIDTCSEDDTSCPDGESCTSGLGCDYVLGDGSYYCYATDEKLVANACIDKEEKYYDCMKKHECMSDGTSFDADLVRTCVFKNCYRHLVLHVDCYCDNILYPIGGKCYDPICKSYPIEWAWYFEIPLPIWVIPLILGIIIIGVIVVIIKCVCC